MRDAELQEPPRPLGEGQPGDGREGAREAMDPGAPRSRGVSETSRTVPAH